MFEKLKDNKALRIIGVILYYLLVLLIVAVLAVVALQRLSNNNLTIGGIRVFNIVSESMVPKYQIGDVLVAKSVDPSTLKVGDDIAYLGEVDTFKDKVVTHQIIAIDYDENGEMIITTKGIANPEQDPQIKASQIYGKIVYHVMGLSLISKIINNIFGFYFLIFVPITILIIIKIRDVVIAIKERKEEGEDDEDEEEDNETTETTVENEVSDEKSGEHNDNSESEGEPKETEKKSRKKNK